MRRIVWTFYVCCNDCDDAGCTFDDENDDDNEVDRVEGYLSEVRMVRREKVGGGEDDEVEDDEK